MSDDTRVPRVVRDGMVAVLYSPGFGAGWSTWGAGERGLYSPELVAAVERGASFDELKHVASIAGFSNYLGGLRDLRIRWLPVGTVFRINEYDGRESIEEISNPGWFVA